MLTSYTVLCILSEKNHSLKERIAEAFEGSQIQFKILLDYDSFYSSLENEDFDCLLTDINPSIKEEKYILTDAQDLLKGKPLFVFAEEWSNPLDLEIRRLGATALLPSSDINPIYLQQIFKLSIENRQIEGSRSSSRIQLAQTYRELELREDRLKQQRSSLIKLANLRLDFDKSLNYCLRKILEVSCETLGVDAISIWTGLDKGKVLKLKKRYTPEKQPDIRPFSIEADKIPLFIKAIEKGESLYYADTVDNPRIKGFYETYLQKHNIVNFASAPLYSSGKFSGAICFEGLGAAREWYEEELGYIYSVADLLTLVTEEWGRREAQRKAQTKEIAYRKNLERSNSELQEFAFIISHDLQEPLYKVIAFGELLEIRNKDELDEKSLTFITKMRDATQRMSNLINELLAYSRVTSKAKPFEKCNLSKVLEGVLSDLEIRIHSKNAQLEIETLEEIDADPTQMRLVFQNLISNSLKFHEADKAPHIEITGLKTNHNTYQIKVKDDGVGFENCEPKKIFGVFQRLHHNDEYDGTGMGLAICQKIISRHNGNIEANAKIGEGAVFTITLPINQENEHSEQNSSLD